MNQAPQSTEAPTWADAMRKLARMAAAEARARLARNRSYIPPLRQDDALGLAILSMVDWWLGIHPPGGRFQPAILKLCSQLAFEFVLRADSGFAVAAGALPRNPWSREYVWTFANRWFGTWVADQERVFAGTLDGDLAPNSREGVLRRLALDALVVSVPRAELVARLRSGVERFDKEWGRPTDPDDYKPASLSATLMLVAEEGQGILPLLRVDSKGRIGISDLAVRDKLGPRGRNRPETSDLEKRASGEPGLDALTMEADRSGHVRQTREAIAAVAEVRAKRRALGSARRAVLENANALLSGELGLRELAERTRLSASGLSQAWQCEREALAKDPGVKRSIEGL